MATVAAVIASALATRGIALIGPLLADTSAQARAGAGYARDDQSGLAVLTDQRRFSERWCGPCGLHRGNERRALQLRDDVGAE